MDILELLYEAFDMEYNDVFTYIKEAEIIRDEKLKRKLEEFSQMEVIHADKLAMRIIELKGKPVWKFKDIQILSSNREMVKKHIKDESVAYQHYQKIIDINDDKDFRLILKGIQSEEKYHLETLIEFLKKWERGR